MSFGDYLETSRVSIEQLTRRDLPAILRIAEEGGLSCWSYESYLGELEREDAVKIVSRVDNRLTGFLIARLITISNEAEIYNIAVEKKYRGRGLGKILVKHFIDLCKSKDIENIWLEVRESNEAALYLYRQNGFLMAGKRKGFYKLPDDDALLLKLSLTNSPL